LFLSKEHWEFVLRVTVGDTFGVKATDGGQNHGGIKKGPLHLEIIKGEGPLALNLPMWYATKDLQLEEKCG